MHVDASKFRDLGANIWMLFHPTCGTLFVAIRVVSLAHCDQGCWEPVSALSLTASGQLSC